MTTLKAGDKVPDFTGTDQNEKSVSLSDFKGKKIILYFYPKDNTPTCTVEACNLRDNYADLTSKGFEVIGVSPDSEKKHQNFIKKYELPFTLLADTNHTIMNAYEVWGTKKFMGKVYDGVHRITFVIDENGMIERVFEKVKSKIHTEQILESYG